MFTMVTYTFVTHTGFQSNVSHIWQKPVPNLNQELNILGSSVLATNVGTGNDR